MALFGLPDFQRPLTQGGGLLYGPYGQVGSYTLLPQRLTIAQRADGTPDFALALVRGTSPHLPPQPHGIVDFRLQIHYSLAEALEGVRSHSPGATVQPATFETGYLRLHPTTQEIPDDVRVPVPLVWSQFRCPRYTLKLSDSVILKLKGALQAKALLLLAQADLALVGVAPRVPLRVRFNPAKLVADLAERGDAQRHIARQDILAYFSQPPETLPLEFDGEPAADGDFAAAMTDWVCARLGQWVPSPENTEGGTLALSAASEGRFEWDLSQPQQAVRPITLTLNPLEAAQELAQAQGIEAVFQETVVPALPTGAFSVQVQANLPPGRQGLLAVGVTLKAPPVLPYRLQAQAASAEFTAPEDRAQVVLRLSPSEALAYTYSTFVVIKQGGRVQQRRGPELPSTASLLHLPPDQFPVEFVSVEADGALLAIATLTGICRWQQGEHADQQSFQLTHGQPAVALALPQSATAITLEFTARSRNGSQTLHLPPAEMHRCQLGLHSFAEYGPHQIEIDCLLRNRPLFAVDLLPENAPETKASLVVFTPQESQKTWHYLATSPFHCGYRYRPHGAAGAAWSLVQSPFEPLTLDAHPGDPP